MEYTKEKIHEIVEKTLKEPKGEPALIRCAGCEIHLFTTNPKLASECSWFFESEGENNRQFISPAPILTIITYENEKLWSLLRDTLNSSNVGWHLIDNEAAPDQLQLKCRLNSEVEIVWNNRLKTFYIIKIHLQSIQIIGDGKESYINTSVIYAIIEWITLWLHQGAGWIPVHGSAVSRKGCGILFLGDRRSGKTSTLLTFLENGEYEFVANDRTFIRKITNTWQIIGFPSWFSIRSDTIKYFPKLSQCRTLVKTERQILSILEVQRCIFAGLSLIFFVSFNSSISESQIHRLSIEDVHEKLAKNILNQELNFLRGMFGVQKENIRVQVKDLCEHIPAYSLTQNIENLSSTVRLVERLVRRADI
jgi:hypothetical protein